MENEATSRDRATGQQRVLAYCRRNGLSVVVFAVAFLVRIVYLLAYAKSPFFQVHIADALYHENWALRILSGDVFSLRMPGVLYKPPLYPYFIALAYLLSGKSNLFLLFLQVVMTAFGCLLLFLIGKRYFSAPAAFVGALTYSFYFPSVYFSAEMEIPALAIFLTLLSFYVLITGQRTISLVISATVFALSLLTLPTNVLLLPLYLFVLARRPEALRRWHRKVLLFSAVVLVTILPCTVRNLIAGRHLTFISANGGMNFYIGNNEQYDTTVYLQPGYAFEDFYDEPRRSVGASTFADRDQYWYKKGFNFILKHPGREALLLFKKAVLYFADYEIYRNTDSYYAKANSIYRRVPFVPASLILATGLVGLFLAVRQKRNWELGAFCILQALPCLIFFVTDRYRLPSMGVWVMFSGFFATSMVEAIRIRAWRSGLAVFAVAACLAIVSSLNLFVVRNPAYRPHLNLGFIYETQMKYDLALSEYSTALRHVKETGLRDVSIESEIHARLGNVYMTSGNLEAARKSFKAAIAVNPNSGPAYSYLGTLYDKEKRDDLAVEMFTRAIDINPWDVVSIHNFGLFYLSRSRLDEAVARFQRAIDLAPEHAAAHNDLAYAYGELGKLDLMEREAKSAIYYDPGGSIARYNLASFYLNTGRVEEAITQYNAIVKDVPRDSANAYNQLGVICAQRGNLKQAIDNWQKTLEVDPENKSALDNLQKAKVMMMQISEGPANARH